MKNFVDAMISGGFDSRKHPSLIGTAIDNASANYHEQNKMPELFSTEVYKLGKVILPFVKDVLSGSGSSRAREFHPHPLTEPCVKVSPHTALHTQFFVHRHNLGV